MHEIALWGFVAVIGIVGTLITAMPVAAWFRRRRDRAALRACFIAAFEEGTLTRVTYARDRKFVGDGWIDTYRGRAGTMRFVFSATIEPWVRVRTYRLYLDGGRDPRDGSQRDVDDTFVADPDTAPDALMVRLHAVLREKTRPTDAYLHPEAS